MRASATISTVSEVAGGPVNGPYVGNEAYRGAANAVGYATTTTVTEPPRESRRTPSRQPSSPPSRHRTSDRHRHLLDRRHCLGTGALNASGVATFTTAALPGTHTVSATYGGDSKSDISSGTASLVPGSYAAGDLIVTQVGTPTSATISSISEFRTTATATTSGVINDLSSGQAVTIAVVLAGRRLQQCAGHKLHDHRHGVEHVHLHGSGGSGVLDRRRGPGRGHHGSH